MSKELIERINVYKTKHTAALPIGTELLTACQQRIEVDAAAIAAHEARIEELEQENAGLKAELDGWKDGSEAAQNEYAALILRSNHKIGELEQENSRLQGRVEAEARSGMQSLRTQENLFGAKLDALQAQLEAASGYLGRLLTTVWPQIELCPDLMGICTQIDHLLASLRDNRVKEDKEKV